MGNPAKLLSLKFSEGMATEVGVVGVPGDSTAGMHVWVMDTGQCSLGH